MTNPKPIKVTLARNGQYLQASWYEPTGRRRRKSLGHADSMTRYQAMLACAKLEVELNSRTQHWEVRKNPTVQYICDDWLANRKGNISEATYDGYSRVIIPFLIKSLGGDTKCGMVMPEEITRYRHALSRRYKTSTAAHHFRIAKSVFIRAVKQRFLETNPFDLVDAPPSRVSVEHQYIPPDEFERVLAHEDNPYYACYFALLRYAGLRANEPLRLRWEHIDLKQYRIHVPGNDDGRVTTKKRPRTVPLVRELFDYFDDIKPDIVNPKAKLLPDITRFNCRHRMTRMIELSKTELRFTPQTLRVSRENEWIRHHPAPEVASWLGHSVQTQIKSYYDPRSPVAQRTMDAAVNSAGTIVGTKTSNPSENISQSA